MLIGELAASFGAPVFEPHVTLLGGLAEAPDELWGHAERLALTLAPLRIELQGIEEGETFFRRLFVSVKTTSELRQAEVRARQGCGSKRTAPFAPHISLLYAPPLAPGAGERIRKEFAPRLPRTFTIDQLCLVSTEGPPEAWSRVGEVRIVAPGPALE